MSGAFYRQVDEARFESTPLTAGPWSPDSQHAGPRCSCGPLSAPGPGRTCGWRGSRWTSWVPYRWRLWTWRYG